MSSFDVESLFQSIDIILTQRLNALSYDTTVIATITNDSDKDNGHYIVSDGTIKFDAYTTDTTYKQGDQVRVTVMNGDWSQKKFIEGKYSNKENEGKPITYIPPLGTTLQGQAGLLDRQNWTLWTNGQTYASNPFIRMIPEDSNLFNLQTRGLYDVLTISADISTDLGTLTAGNYGLRLDLLITPEVGSKYRIQKFITFDSSEMIGNPYSFVIPTHQEKRIPIAELGHVTEIVLTPYQGITIDDRGVAIPTPFLDTNGQLIGQLPIHFNNVQIGFGSDLASVEDNSLKLYSPNVPMYNYNAGMGTHLNKKQLGFVWFNKNENDEYIGFSDGKYNPSYDEIEYMQASDFDTRLLAQLDKTGVPTDEQSLTLAADIADAVPLMKSAYTALTTSLSQVLKRFHGQLAGATSILNELEPLISQYKDEKGNSVVAKLVQAQTDAEAAAASLEQQYINVLKYGYNIQNGNDAEWPGVSGNYLSLFENAINQGINDVKAFLQKAKDLTEVGEPLAGYRRIYNDYAPKVKKEISAINAYIDQIPIKLDYLGTLTSYQTKTKYEPYHKTDFSAYDNYYCVYWYRYNELYNLEYIAPGEMPEGMTEAERIANNIEYKYGQLLGEHWERLTIQYDVDDLGNIIPSKEPLTNFGLPGQDGDTGYLKASADDGQTPYLLNRWMDPCSESEKYRVVLFYNHEMFKSDIVVFNNADEVPPQFKVDAGDVLRIEHDADSKDHYQVYSSANDLLNISDGYKSRQLKCFYDGVLSGDEALADAEIYWYIPVNSTMLTYDKEFLIKKGFTTDDMQVPVYDEDGNQVYDENGEAKTEKVKTPYSKDGYVYFNKKIGYTRTEEIMTDEDGNEMYDSNGIALRETVITIDSEDRFFFYKIKSFYESSAQNNTILVYAYVPNKEEPTVGEINFTFGTFGSNGTKYTLAITPATDQIAVLPAANIGDDSGNLQLNLTLYNANSEKLDMTTVVGDSTGYYNLTAEWYASSAKAPTLGEIKNIENSKSKSIEALGVLNTNYDTNKYAGIVKASVSYQGAGVNEATNRVITLSALYSVPYASSEDLYISGPTSIIYNSQGTVSRLSEEPYCLYQHTKDGDIKIENQSWSLIYYDNDGDLIDSNYRDYQQILAFLPKLAEDNTLIPSPLYCDYGDNLFYIPVAVCKVDNNIVWTQPIIIIQNAYESSMLNDWDGSLQINKENGTIMATMVGAGVKNPDNTFSGVLMGDIVAGADFDSRNAKGLGLYGFYHGAQNFNFSVDGTAFLGKAGSGRIYFNGDKGTIKSGSYDINGESGMLIDLDDALIHMRGANSEIRLNALASGYTPYFQITSPKTNNSLIFISDNNYYLQSSNFNGENGMNIDLDTGRITSYNFRLDAWQNNSGIQMDSGGSPYYFKVGANESNYISLNRNMLDIKATNFELDAWMPSGDFEKGIYINSSGLPYYFKVGSSVDNYISLGSSGLDIKTKQFELNAWNGNQGIYINSNPIGDMPTGYYLLVGEIAEDKKNHNYIGLHNVDGLSIYTNKFELNTPTLQISSGNEQEKPFFEVRTGYTPDGKVLTHIASDKIYLQSDNFSFDKENNGLKIDITEKQILFGKSAKMSFISDDRGNYVEITSGKDWSEDKTTIALYVRPRFVSQDVYITHSLYGGTDPTGTDTAAVNAVSNTYTMSKVISGPGVEEENTQAGNGDNRSNTENTGAKLPFPDFEETIMKPDDNDITTRWSINQYGKGKGIHLANSCLYGQITIGKWDGTGSANNPTYGSTNPFFRCYVPAYIGQIAIQNNEIWNETGLDNPITFKSPVTFASDIPTVFESEVTFNKNASLILNAQDMQIDGMLKIKIPSTPIIPTAEDKNGNVLFLAGQYGTLPCIKIYDHLAVEDKIYAKRLWIEGNGKEATDIVLGKTVGLGVFGNSYAMRITPKEIVITDAVTDGFNINTNTTFKSGVLFESYSAQVKINGPVEINGIFQVGTKFKIDATTFVVNTALISLTGTVKINNLELGDLAFADEIKKNFNVTMTAALPSGYYTKTGKSSQSYYDYTISQGSRTVSGTANGTYVATGNEVAGEEYSVECSYSDTYSVDELSYDLITIEYDTFTPANGTVTMIGDSGEIAFGPAPEGGAAETESINISADSVTVS